MKGKPTCTCHDFEKRHMDCKHIHAVRFYLDFNNKVKTENKSIVEDSENKWSELLRRSLAHHPQRTKEAVLG